MTKIKLFKCWKTLVSLTIVCLFVSSTLLAQITVRGKIVDEGGLPLPGAVVKLKKGTTAVSSSADGSFIISVPSVGSVLEVSFIGYTNKEVISTNSSMTIQMIPDQRALNEVVVVGYGTLKRQDVTGTVTTVDNKVLQEIPSANVFEQLKGRVAGLDVVNGASGPSITIRGNRTIGNPGADRPLIVLDGQPFYNFIENINPNDIKSIDVLKGASATAIYGSRGSGGVLLITTNRGRVGQSSTSFDSYVGVSNLQGSLDLLDGQQYIQLKRDALEGSILQSNGPSQAYPLTAAEQAAFDAGVNTDWVDLYVKPAVFLDQSLRVSSGTEKTQFNLGVAYRSNGSLEPNASSRRFSLNANIDHTISKLIKIGASLQGSLRTANTGGIGQIGNAQLFSPLARPYNADGTVNFFPLEGQLDAAALSPLAPAAIPNSYFNNTRGFTNNSIIYTEISPLKNLKYRLTLNYNYAQSLQGVYNGINGSGIQTIERTNASNTNNYSYRLVQEHLMTYDNVFAGKHNVNFVGGFTTEKQRVENSNASATNIPSDAVRNTNLGLGTFNSQGGNFNEQGLISYIGRLNYAFDNRYNLTATYRVDANSALAVGNQYTSYPSVGLGWVISNESFMKKYTFLDNLKLRAGYGETSTTASISPYGTLGRLGTINYQFGGVAAGNQTGVRVTTLTNNNLTWQRTSDYNLALDFGFLNNRLTGSIEVYQQRTTGIILNNILPPTTGAGGQATNLGTSANKGLEIALNSINIQKPDSKFSWSTDFNIAFSRERIVELPNGVASDINAGLFVGQPLTTIYDLKKIGIWQISDSRGLNVPKSTSDGGPVYQPVNGQTAPLQYPGQIRVEDLNGDGKIDQKDNQFIGNFQPDYTFGFNNRVSYKNFDFSISVQARMGFTTIVPYVSSSNSGLNGWQFLNLGRRNQPDLDYWTPKNPDGQWPMPNNQFQSQFYSTLQYFDGSFIRAKSINFGYNLPSKFTTKFGVTSLRVYANVTNPFIIYSPLKNQSFSVSDPESISNIQPASVFASGNVAGYNANTGNGFRGVGVSPGLQTRDFIFGINLRF